MSYTSFLYGKQGVGRRIIRYTTRSVPNLPSVALHKNISGKNSFTKSGYIFMLCFKKSAGHYYNYMKILTAVKYISFILYKKVTSFL